MPDKPTRFLVRDASAVGYDPDTHLTLADVQRGGAYRLREFDIVLPEIEGESAPDRAQRLADLQILIRHALAGTSPE